MSDTGSIALIEAQIAVIAKTVTDIKAVYDYPITTLGRKLPALTILYDGFTQGPGPDKHTENRYNFEFTLYLPLEGRKMKTDWDNLKILVPTVLDKFRANPGLNGTCWLSRIEAGDPIIDVPSDPRAKPKFIGHSFRLFAHKEENP